MLGANNHDQPGSEPKFAAQKQQRRRPQQQPGVQEPMNREPRDQPQNINKKIPRPEQQANEVARGTAGRPDIRHDVKVTSNASAAASGKEVASPTSREAPASAVDSGTQELNNLIYQAIRNHKQREQERQMAVIRDAQSITETMIRKRREADENKSVVTASSMYANNAQYVSINSGGDGRIRLSSSIHPLNPDECDVYTSLVDASENSTIRAAANHCMSDNGEIEGFRFTCSGSDVASVLPVSRRMFFRVSMVECELGMDDWDFDGTPAAPAEEGQGGDDDCASRSGKIEDDDDDLESFVESYNANLPVGEEGPGKRSSIGLVTAAILRSRGAAAAAGNAPPIHGVGGGTAAAASGRGGGGVENPTILKLLLRHREVRERLVKLVRRIHEQSIGNEASFACLPDNSDILDGHGRESSGGAVPTGRVDPMELFGTMHNRKASDCRPWMPEMPERVGIYHAYVRGFNKDTRSHKLFIVTSGGCTSMCDAYFNMFVDVRNNMSVADVFNSEETWFLRNACRRNNARILLAVAEEFRLKIPTVSDTYDADRGQIASCTTETLIYDVVKERGYNRFSLLNRVCDTTLCQNGILCPMHPSEGVWLFKGPVNTSSAMTLYGGSFGVSSAGSAFPVGTTKTHPNYSWKSKSVPGSEVCRGEPCLVRSRDSTSIDRVDTNGSLLGRDHAAQENEIYTYIDETYIRGLQQDCGWCRDNGIIELIPIAVVQQSGI